MRIFVAGATGVVGRRAVGLLAAADHEVSAVARNGRGAQLLTGLGVIPVAVDLFDTEGVRSAVAGHDVVINLATRIPTGPAALRPDSWRENDRLRGEASRILAEAALQAGAARFIQESIVLIYADHGEAWICEDAAVDATRPLRSVLQAEEAAARVREAGADGVALRFGLFYGPDSRHTMDMVAAARRGMGMVFGPPQAYLPSTQTDDAATAVVAALAVPPGVYNVVDDEPLPRAEFLAALADAVGRRTVLRPPSGLRHVEGLKALSRSLRVSNAALRSASSWQPQHPSAREGLPAVVSALEGVIP